MNIQEISSFLAVCKYGTFSKAAENLYMTQPTISWYINSLEKELGQSLFIRKRGQKESRLTNAGHIFYPQAIKWETLWNETLSLLNTETYIRYNFACIPSLAPKLFPFLHAYFKEAMSDCSISLFSRPSPIVINGVENNEYDAGVSAITTATNRTDIVQIASEKLVFMCRKDSNFPDKISVYDLIISNCIYVNWTHDLGQWRQKYFHEKPYAELSAFDGLISFFENPDIWAIVPFTSFFSLKNEYRICELDCPPSDRRFYLATSTTPKTEFNTLLLDALKKFFKIYDDGIKWL